MIELGEFIAHCRVLLDEIDEALLDLIAEGDGWKTHYAVDFSEIYAYTLPDESHETSPFLDGWSSEGQFFVLSRFFGEGKILLPEPYAIELAGFQDRLVAAHLSMTAEHYIAVLSGLHGALADRRTEQILALTKSAENVALTTEEIERVFEYFETHAPQLVALARGIDLQPIARLHGLLQRRPFAALESAIPDIQQHMDPKRERRRFELLEARRKHSNPAASFIDARALEEVQAANELLWPRRERVLLISRSPHMISVIRADSGSPSEVFIRHPRTLQASLRFGAEAAELRLRKASLETFIAAATEATQRRGAANTRERDVLSEVDRSTSLTLRQLLERVQREWESVETYTTALTSVGEPSTHESRQMLAVELLSFLRERDQLRRRVHSQIRELFREVRRGRDMVAFRLQSRADETPIGAVDYPIHFRDERLRQATQVLAEQWWSSLTDAETLFELAIELDDEYECLLGIAVSLRAIGRWGLAQKYVDYALMNRPEGARAEGLFLRAVSEERMSMEYETTTRIASRIARTVSMLDEAIAESNAIDPRFSNERAASLLRLAELERDSHDPATIAFELSQALPLAHGKLRIQVLANLCSARLLAGDTIRLKAELDELRASLIARSSDRSKWPAFAVDTLIYGSFWLQRQTAGPETRKVWARELRAAAAQPVESPRLRRMILDHVAEIVGSLDESIVD